MIQSVDDRLRAWVGDALGDVAVSFGLPGALPGTPHVNLYLLSLAGLPPSRAAQRSPHQFLLRYLASAWADDPHEAHRLLGMLAFAALDMPDMTVSFEAPPVELWTAFGIAPRPCFILDIPVRQERPDAPVKRVRAPLVVRGAPATTLQGVILGPQDIPLADARVEFPALNLATTTDSQGRFRFPTVPAGLPARALRILTKGHALDVVIDQTVAANQPIVIRVDLFRE